MRVIAIKCRCGRRGFTLTELLVVIGIMSLMMTFTSVSLPGLMEEGQVKRAVYQIGETLDQARTYAMAQNTYVWVRFENAASTGLQLQIHASRDQTGDPASSNLVPVGKTLQFQQMGLAANLPAYGGRDPDATKIAVSEAIQFTPQGEALLASGSGAAETYTLNKCIEVGLQSLHGKAKDTAALQVAGLTGQAAVYRP